MDLKLHRPQSICSRTGRGLSPGESFFSALVRGPEGLDRIDVAAEAWDGPPADAIAWWKSVCPAPTAAGPTLAPVDVLLDAIEGLEEAGSDEPVRYLLALQLARRRILKLERVEDGSEAIIFGCRRRDREYRIDPVDASVLADPQVASRLTTLLWSGEAA